MPKMFPEPYERQTNIHELLPPELRDKWWKATKKEKNEIMNFYYEYVT